jgi:hypothetical protein
VQCVENILFHQKDNNNSTGKGIQTLRKGHFKNKKLFVLKKDGSR